MVGVSTFSNRTRITMLFGAAFGILCISSVCGHTFGRIMNGEVSALLYASCFFASVATLALNVWAYELAYKMIEYGDRTKYHVVRGDIPLGHLIMTDQTSIKLLGWVFFCAVLVFNGLLCLEMVQHLAAWEAFTKSQVDRLIFSLSITSMTNVFRLVAPFDFMCNRSEMPSAPPAPSAPSYQQRQPMYQQPQVSTSSATKKKSRWF